MVNKTSENQNNHKKNRTSEKPSFDLVTLYLVTYNVLQTFGWTVIFLKLITFYLVPSSKTLYESEKLWLNIFQNAAVLEVVHAVTGIVRTNAILTAFQVASRVVVVCGILMATYSPRDSVGLPLALLAWSITEIIRYSNYALGLLNAVPYSLKFLRYTLFIILYPIGITGELLCIFAASQEVGKGRLYTIDMPNQYNFIFNYQHLLWFLMLLYLPLFPQLYLYMFSQRAKFLGLHKANSNSKIKSS